MRKWGVANLLSDQEDTLSGYRYNQGSTWMSSTVGSTSYDLGSINLYIYSPQPQIIDIGTTLPSLGAASNLYVDAGNLSGLQSWEIQMRSNVRLTVIVRDPIP